MKNQYEFVEILSEYDEKVGINVVYLYKVKSFTSVLALTPRDRSSSFRISPEELHRFSHGIPSFKLTGEERVGVPKGCFELDPASISSNIKEIDLSHNHGDVDEVRAQGKSSHMIRSLNTPGLMPMILLWLNRLKSLIQNSITLMSVNPLRISK
ncbi:hypothetical protein SAY86_007125 [Trapa natans]|uniref:DUF3444 domain-containing protein n=1 Tax=Trapa natans TaxID=22666 RepID=A0AAN7LL62_TRANT|nr:hypothetical protein SAY86_007125 [Trapa natans]